MSANDDDLVRDAYRALDADLPSAAIDDAIRAAARRAVHARPGAIARIWFKPIAAAAVVVLGLSVVLVAVKQPTSFAPPPAAPRENTAAAPVLGGTATLSKDQPAEAELLKRETTTEALPQAAVAQGAIAAPPPAAKPVAKLRDDKFVERDAASPPPPAPPPPPPAMSARSAETRAEAPPIMAAPVVAPSAPQPWPETQVSADAAPKEDAERKQIDSPLEEITITGSRMRQEPQMAPAQSILDAGAAAASATQNPALWLQSLRELRASGDRAAFDAELRRFRAAWPNYPLPQDW